MSVLKHDASPMSVSDTSTLALNWRNHQRIPVVFEKPFFSEVDTEKRVPLSSCLAHWVLGGLSLGRSPGAICDLLKQRAL